MLKHDPNFSRIRVRARGLGGVASYWLGPDHLLIVEVAGTQERYRRFYYRDIQAIAMRRTEWGRVWNGVLGLLAFFLGLGATLVDELPGQIAFGIAAVVFLVAGGWNTWRGPTCSCQLRTAVQADELPGLHRLRSARQAIAELRVRVVQAQGALSATELSAAPPVLAESNPSATVSPQSRSSAPLQHNAGYPGHFHAILCWLLFGAAAFSLVDLFWQNDRMDYAGLAVAVAGLVLTVFAIVRQSGSLLPHELRRLTWTLLGYQLFLLAVAIGYGIYLAIKEPDRVGKTESPWDNPLLLAMDFTTIIVGTLAGIAGLLLLARFRRERLTPPPLAPTPPPPPPAP